MVVQALEPQLLPVGSILAYAGQLDDLSNLGWLFCSGQTVSRAMYPDLCAALAGAYGLDNAQDSYLPDLRGYFLRGLDPGGTVDPDVSKRTAIRQGANLGAKVGSCQSYATARPHKAFRGQVQDLQSVEADDHQAWGTYCVDATTGTIAAVGGGDPESVPVNVSVRWIIKAAEMWQGSTVLPPIGAVSPFASDKGPPNTMWTACDGAVVKADAPNYQVLNYVLGTLHGRSDNAVVLPDLRGYFLRGRDDNTGRDKCLRNRNYPGSDIYDVNVGSRQNWYTAPPSNSFTTDGFRYPSGHIGNVMAGSSQSVYTWDAWTDITIALSDKGGGDTESRPVNTAVDYLLCADGEPPVDDGFAIGMIVALAGNGPAPSKDFWLRCDGSAIPKTFPLLVKALGNATNLPDLRGRFLRGRDPAGTVDKDGKGRPILSTQSYATGAPRLQHFSATWPHWPNSTYKTFGATGKTWGPPTLNEQDTCTGGGDRETRPINVAVDFYIKAANGS